MNRKSTRILWVDDDGEDRYLHERMLLTERGWNIDWATTVLTAADFLRTKEYRALLVDQMLPLVQSDAPTVWGGCVLLRWLRHAELPIEVAAYAGDCERLRELSPAAGNSDVNVMIVSAYWDADVAHSIDTTLAETGRVRSSPKPVQPAELIRFLDDTRTQGSSAMP